MAHMTNPLATVDQLYARKNLSSLPTDLQDIIFYETQCLTQAAGLLLRLPQSVTAQANVVLARHWLSDSPLDNEFSDVSAAAIFLIAKLSAHPTPCRDICNVYTYLTSASSQLFHSPPHHTPDPSSYYLSESAYSAFHARILSIEGRILQSLGFDTHVALPHPLAITYLQALEFFGGPADQKRVARRTVAYLNSALLSPQLLCVTHQPHALAVAAVYAAARDVELKMPEQEWWEIFDVEREELGFLVVAMRSLEGFVRRTGEAEGGLGKEGMVTRAMVREALKKRELALGNGGKEGMPVRDEEDLMMRSLDERAAQMDG